MHIDNKSNKYERFTKLAEYSIEKCKRYSNFTIVFYFEARPKRTIY